MSMTRVLCAVLVLVGAGCVGAPEDSPTEAKEGALSQSSPFGCDHSPCKVGSRLVAGCGDYGCVATICAQNVDPYCCNNAWDARCVSEVPTYCGHRCDCSQAQTAGAPFYPDASKCTLAISNEDPYCADTAWDNLCVAETVLPNNHAACNPLCQ